MSRGIVATCTSPVTVAANDGVDGSVTYCCSTDLCNGSSINSSNFLFPLAISLFVSLLYIHI